MEIRARYDLMQAKGAWEKLESEMRADQETAKKSSEAQMDSINRYTTISETMISTLISTLLLMIIVMKSVYSLSVREIFMDARTSIFFFSSLF